MVSDWKPSATIAALRLRAQCYQQIRSFFAERDVLEVETPALSCAAVSDPYLIPMSTEVCAPGYPAQTLYLHTSPEYPMKRLLAAGSGSIYQLCKVFRNDECGRNHNPEFTLLEWYRVGFDEHQLMDEVEALYRQLVPSVSVQFDRLSYRDVFLQYLQLDPHQASASELARRVHEQVDASLELDSKDGWLELLFSHLIEPQLQTPTFVYDYPASQAALAERHNDRQGVSVARRFELYACGTELANGYYELRDAVEQEQRFIADQQRRKALGMDELPVDEYLLAALKQGMPPCAGVALGVDRLLMVAQGLTRIEQTLAFSTHKS